ncbi:Sulfate/thiosulfate import ATP-binding protein CysA [Chlamydia avium]|uniref:ABC transporter family protein n=2 Tax=Chlamydia avium TaxID=1457141 RepID=W8JFE8_9CHLA|nr:ATP-binding cassette domain-containing protein [Chlamydia avium]AHK63271.1 ABC transporter family protein [Chlamydia avium 10DC88]EPP37339.1 ABC transporter family protein [Chlamydia psittaci 10_743_SC13]EPP38007.1 ABC transporter family protein [Chlamydia avium]VVT42872.1 Sulfate/thiosulfate import ATP-binding protein CysA [Chlamydia avium]
MKEPWIIVDSIDKSYCDSEGQKYQVLHGVSLQVFPDEFLVILGKSGTGKSVLLRHIIGLEIPDSGEVRYSEALTHKGRLRELTIGMVFQGGALFDFLSVRDNVAFGLHAYNERHKTLSVQEIDEKVNQALANVGLEYVADFMPNKLSGGMVKRVALARSLVYSPKLVLYDEPTAGLDPVTSREMTLLISRVRKEQGIGGVIITHDITLALSLADRIAIHDRGTISRIYTREEFVQTEDPLAKQFLLEHL